MTWNFDMTMSYRKCIPMEIYKIMKKILQLLTLCTAFNLWAPVAGEMNSVAVNLNRFVDGMVRNRGENNGLSVYPEERVPLVPRQNLSNHLSPELTALRNKIIQKNAWDASDSIDMIKLLKPANEEFVKVGNNYLQEIDGIFILCDKRETARNIAAFVTGVLAGGVAVGGAYLYVQYKEFIDPIITALFGFTAIGLLAKKISNEIETVSLKDILNWFVSLIYKPAESMFPDQLHIADELVNISFFRNNEKCKELYTNFADMTIAKNLSYFTGELHKNSHRSLVISSERGFNLLGRKLQNLERKLEGIEENMDAQMRQMRQMMQQMMANNNR